jgi:hypothetical protein
MATLGELLQYICGAAIIFTIEHEIQFLEVREGIK